MELKTMETEIPKEDEQETSLSDTDWDNRILCSDDNCIGVIGPDGHCKECGKEFEGSLPEAIVSDQESQPDESRSDQESQPDESRSDQESQPDESRDSADIDAQPQSSADITSGEKTKSGDWANRQLCSDGNCIGVIGPDGRCKECGKALE
jgi:hypothetical protein